MRLRRTTSTRAMICPTRRGTSTTRACRTWFLLFFLPLSFFSLKAFLVYLFLYSIIHKAIRGD